MCGLTAIFAYRPSGPPVRQRELETITDRMRARGPDAGGSWLSADERVGLGSRRLAIVDLSDDGTQPMWDVHRELAIVFNGEIYNHRELRASLERGGAQFHSRTDTEVLLQLYRRDGERMLGLLRGMYAFAIWDTRERRLFVARDPYGIKPLYYADDGATIRIASQVKALLAGGNVSRTTDPAGAAGFFLMGSVPEPFTICEGISAVPAGMSFTVNEDRGRLDFVHHHSVAESFRRAAVQRRIARLTRPDIAFQEMFRDSVAHHLVADVPVGVFLSAGIDSSAIALAASALYEGQLRTITLRLAEFHGSDQDESGLAERFARDIGTRHSSRTVTRDEFRGDLPAILDAMDQPTIDGVNTWFVSKAAAETGLKVTLSGLGGDELLGGYPSFQRIPKMVRLARSPLARLTPLLSRHPKASRVAALGKSFAGAYLLQRGLFLAEELPALMGNDAARAGLERLAILDLIGDAMTPDPATSYGRIAALEASIYMKNQLLRDTDWASMAHSVEVRTPLADVALLARAAPVLLGNKGASKQLLASGLPPYLRRRPKTGFFVPIAQWADLPPDGTSRRMRSWARLVFEAATQR